MWRSLTWLVLAGLAACASTTPVGPPVETGRQAVQPQTPIVEAGKRPSDSTDLLTSEACEQNGNHLCAIEAMARYISAQPATGYPAGHQGSAPPPGRQALHDRLWRLTAALSPVQVTALAKDHDLAPLWQLRQALSSSRSAREQVAELNAWMNRWSDHAFVSALPGSLARLLQLNPSRHRVGLFVPLSGPLGSAGRAVRDGFIAAYFDDTAPGKPALRIYDSAANPIPTLYEQGLVDAVDLIVGPLNKHRLAALSRLHPELPVLGLNYLEGTTGTHRETDPGAGSDAAAGATRGGEFLQMGLAIEDEAATISRRLLSEDVQRLLAVHGTEDWAVRGVQALAAGWPHDLELQAFADVRTITESVGEAMQVAASLQRREELQRLLNTSLEFMPRARTDLDGVVAFVNHIEAAALAPALKFHYPGSIPVYASSQSVRGASALGELNGFQVAEMPFNLYSDPLWNAVQQAFDGRRGNTAALHALGMDAYLIVNHWQWIADHEPLYGATGKLQRAEDGRIQRTLAWGSVTRGKVRAMTSSAGPRSR